MKRDRPKKEIISNRNLVELTFLCGNSGSGGKALDIVVMVVVVVVLMNRLTRLFPVIHSRY